RFPTALEFLRAIRRLRGRATSDLKERDERAEARQQRGRTQPAQIHDTGRQRYVTQPMTSTTCTSCGTEVDSDDLRCPVCGQELGATISTARLTQKEASAEKRMRAQLIWFAAALVAFALIALTIYFAQRHSGASQKNMNSANERAATNTASTS